MAKLNFNIQLFNSTEDLYFNPDQQHKLIMGTTSGLNTLIEGTNDMILALNKLASEWVSPEADVVGNQAKDSLKDFIPKSQNYVASIGGWMRYHGTRLNIANKRNDELEKMKDVDGNISLKVFQKEGPWIGLRDTSTVKGLKQYLENGLAKVNNGLGLVLRTVESNPDAFAQGVVPNDLLPTVQEQNDIVSNSFKNLKTNLTAVVLRIDAAIKAAAAEAKAGAKGTKS